MKLPPKCFDLWVFLIVLIFMMQFSLAQNSISGKIQDIEGEPLSFANVLLLKTSDSTLIKGTMTEITGEFILDNIPGKVHPIGKYGRIRIHID